MSALYFPELLDFKPNFYTSNTMKLILVAFSLMTVGASALDLIHANRMPQSLDTRASFYGGWPLAATTCPSNTTSCDDGSCCPTTTDCYIAGLAGAAACCPDSK